MSTQKRSLVLFSFLILILISLAGCQPETVPTGEAPAAPVAAAMETVTAPTATAVPPTPTDEAATTAPPEPTARAEDETVTATVDGLSLACPANLVEDITVETVPATEMAPDDWQMRYLAHPAMTVLTLSGFPVSREYQQAHISVLPVEAASSLTLRAEQRVEQLQSLLVAQPERPLSAEELPYLPLVNAAQLMHSRETYLSFAGGSGLRYLSAYAQAYVPVTNNNLQYTFQGITDDGRFYVSASFPVRSEALPVDIPAAEAIGWDGTTHGMDRLAHEAYIAEQHALLEGLAAGDFTPTLDTLDALVQSLDLSAYQGPATEPWAAEVLPGPDQLLDDFLERYTAAGGFWAGAYLDDPALHPDYVAELTAMRDEWESQGADLSQYDPILMSANLGGGGEFAFPMLEVGPALTEDERARVFVERFSYPGGTVLPLIFTLDWAEEAGTWQIRDTSTILSHPQREVTGAEQVVESVFAPGLAARPGMEDPGIENLALPTDAGSSLCAQDCPWGFVVEGAFPTGEQDAAGNPVYDVVVYTSFDADPQVIRVEPQGESYVVTGRTDVSSPAERARAFCTWYLSEAAVSGETRWAERRPEIARMNDLRVFVSERFLREASLRMVREDPYLPSGRVPEQFRVEAGPEENTALVHLGYEDGEMTLVLTFVEEMGRLLIDNIEEGS